ISPKRGCSASDRVDLASAESASDASDAADTLPEPSTTTCAGKPCRKGWYCCEFGSQPACMPTSGDPSIVCGDIHCATLAGYEAFSCGMNDAGVFACGYVHST